MTISYTFFITVLAHISNYLMIKYMCSGFYIEKLKSIP